MSDYLSKYRPPSSEQITKLEEAEDLYVKLEAFIRENLKPGMFRQQALFRLRESETWTKEGLKGGDLDEPPPRQTRSGSYIIE